MTESLIETKNGSRLFSWAIFLLPALALDFRYGVGLTEIFMLLGMVSCSPRLFAEFRLLPVTAQLLIAVFFANLVVAALTISWRGNEFNFLDNPVRQLLIMSAIVLIPLARPLPMYFWTGLIVGCLAALAMAIYQYAVLHIERAFGAHQSILFGDIAMAMGLMSLAAVVPIRQSNYKRLFVLAYLAFVAGVVASALSGTRGGWAAIILALLPLSLVETKKHFRIVVFTVVAGLMAIFLSVTTLHGGVETRAREAYSDIQKFQQGNVNTSVGLRFEMWRASAILFLENPWTGVGRANFRQGLNTLADQGRVSPGVRVFPHAHNELLNELATAGLAGGIMLLLQYAAPLWFFVRARRDAVQRPFAVAGIVLVLSYIIFGMTEVLFSQHLGAIFYAAFVAVLAGLCIAAQRHETNQAAALASA
jgi:O-antigen ligase